MRTTQTRNPSYLQLVPDPTPAEAPRTPRPSRPSLDAMLDWLASLDDDPRERFWVLDAHANTNDNAWHELRPAFASHLDRARQQPHAGDLVLQARRALRRAERDISNVVERRHFQ